MNLRLAILTGATLLSATSSILAQVQPKNAENKDVWASAENSWRSEPFDINANPDPTSPALRKVRNAYWYRILAPRLEMERAGQHLVTADPSPTRPNIVPDAHGVWVLAKCNGFTVVPIDSDRLIMYTELHFAVEKIVRQPQSVPPTPTSIDVDIMGGTVKTLSGNARSFEVSPRRHSVQPGNDYLLYLRHSPETSSYVIAAFWKIQDGRLRDGSNPKSELSGRSLEDATSHIMSVNAGK